MESFIFASPSYITSQVAARMKDARLAENWSRSTLSDRSGVSESAIKRFEVHGSISFEALIRLAQALGAVNEFAGLFPDKEVVDIEQVLTSQRKRGRQ